MGAVATRRLYRFEDYDIKTKWLDSDQPIAVLEKLAIRIWQKYGTTKEPPIVYAGQGTWYNGRWMSFSAGRTYIELCRNQRTRRVLIHESTHILGPHEHEKNFVDLNIKLLVEFGKYKRTTLIKRMKEAKVL